MASGKVRWSETLIAGDCCQEIEWNLFENGTAGDTTIENVLYRETTCRIFLKNVLVIRANFNGICGKDSMLRKDIVWPATVTVFDYCPSTSIMHTHLVFAHVGIRHFWSVISTLIISLILPRFSLSSDIRHSWDCAGGHVAASPYAFSHSCGGKRADVMHLQKIATNTRRRQQFEMNFASDLL